MNYLNQCNTLQNFSEPNSYTEGHYIHLDIGELKDSDGNIIKNVFNNTKPGAKKRIFITEVYRHSIFAREYGAGKTLHTYTLLPGEETEIHVSTTSTESTATSSILDSFDSTSESDFKSRVQAQETNEEESKELQQISGAVKARGSYGLGSAKGSANFSYNMQASREAYSEKMTEALSQHASTQSAKRTIEVHTSSKESSQAHTESVLRKIKNINHNRTLNFVFRQLNQNFVAIRHLVDVKVAIAEEYQDIGNPQFNFIEYPLTKLEDLLEEHINEKARRKVKSMILKHRTFFDYNNQEKDIYEEVRSPGNDIEYYRFKKCYSIFDENTLKPCEGKAVIPGNCNDPIVVPGYILGVQTQVMKTNGVVVDALLGSNDALEPHLLLIQQQDYIEKVLENKAIEVDKELESYILRMREEDYKEVLLENQAFEKMIEREILAQEIVKNPNNENQYCDNAATRYQQVFCCDSSEDDCMEDESKSPTN